MISQKLTYFYRNLWNTKIGGRFYDSNHWRLQADQSTKNCSWKSLKRCDVWCKFQAKLCCPNHETAVSFASYQSYPMQGSDCCHQGPPNSWAWPLAMARQKSYPPWKLTTSPQNRVHFKRTFHLPTIFFCSGYVSFKRMVIFKKNKKNPTDQKIQAICPIIGVSYPSCPVYFWPFLGPPVAPIYNDRLGALGSRRWER